MSLKPKVRIKILNFITDKRPGKTLTGPTFMFDGP